MQGHLRNEREREGGIKHTDRKTETDRLTDRQAGRQTGRQAETERETRDTDRAREMLRDKCVCGGGGNEDQTDGSRLHCRPRHKSPPRRLWADKED